MTGRRNQALELAQQLEPSDPELAQDLRRMLDLYAFDEISIALEPATGTPTLV